MGGGLINGGLNPKLSEKMGAKILPGKSGPFRGRLGPFQGLLGPCGADRDQIPPHLTATGEAQKLHRKRVLLTCLAPFGPGLHLLSARLDFPNLRFVEIWSNLVFELLWRDRLRDSERFYLCRSSDWLLEKLEVWRVLLVRDFKECFGEERTWAIAIRPFYANQSSELNFPIFIGKKDPNSEERGIYTNPS